MKLPYSKFYENKKFINFILPLFAITILALMLRLGLVTGIAGGDDLKYAEYAYGLANGNYDLVKDEWSSRLGLLVPVALCYKLFGLTEVATILYPFLCSLGGVLLAYALGNLISGQQVGLVSALLAAIFPFAVISAGFLGVDLICAVFAALSFFFFVRSDVDRKYSAGLNLFLSGLVLGAGYLHKETVLWCLPVLLLLLVKKGSKRYGYFLSGLLLPVLLECLVIYRVTGNPFTRWQILVGGPHHQLMAHSYLDGISLKQHILAFLSVLFNPLDKQVLYSGIFYSLAAGSIVYHLIRKEKKVYPLVLWWLVPLAIAILGTNSISTYVPMVQAEMRHVSITIFPAILLIAHWPVGTKSNHKRVLLPMAFAGLIASTIVVLVVGRFYGAWGNQNYSYHERAIYRFLLQEKSEAPIYCTDAATASVLDFFFEYRNDIRIVYPDSQKFAQLQDGLVVINWKRLSYQNRHRKSPASAFVKLPPHWQKLRVIQNPDQQCILPALVDKGLALIRNGKYKILFDEMSENAEIYAINPKTRRPVSIMATRINIFSP